MQHKTVLLHEAVDALDLSLESTVVDATFGSGGHAQEIVKKLGKEGCYIGIDADKTALDIKKLNNPEAKVHLVNNNFVNLKEILSSLYIETVDGILADLGWRMEQFSVGDKGFSFIHEGPLLMTFGEPKDYPFTAAEIINEWDEEVLANIFFGYAQERFSRRIAKAIVEYRETKPIETTTELAEVVTSAYPKVALKKKGIHPATKVFQALRIAVNDELTVLEKFIKDAFSVLKPGGKLAIISFHSIEDRVVKHSMRELVQSELGILTPKKPIAPSETELKDNPRARSAKLRIITKI